MSETTMAFPVIDLVGTGRCIEQRRREAGFTVKELQAYFGFEYPQAIYKWQHGECLPSVDNLLALSRLLRVPMEDLLVYEDQEVFHFFAVILRRMINPQAAARTAQLNKTAQQAAAFVQAGQVLYQALQTFKRPRHQPDILLAILLSHLN